MDLKHLRTFVTVAEQGSVTKAALRLRIAQPALSRQIIDLEQELDLTLFDRVGRRLLLTGEGEQLLGNCRRLLGYASSLTDQAHELRRGDRGVLIVAASAYLIDTVFSAFLHHYAEHFPDVRVRFIEAVGRNALTIVERGEAQLTVSLDEAVPIGNDVFGSYPFPSIEFCAACPTSLAIGHGLSIDIRQLAPFQLLLLDPGYLLRKTFDAACRLAGLRPDILIECSSPHTLLALAEAGHGVAIVPSLVPLDRYRLKTLRLTHERKPLRQPRSIFWDKRRTLPRYAQDFCKLLAAHIRKVAPIVQRSSDLRCSRAKSK
jgi:DNA-binding transcriptional LysR family regulator